MPIAEDLLLQQRLQRRGFAVRQVDAELSTFIDSKMCRRGRAHGAKLYIHRLSGQFRSRANRGNQQLPAQTDGQQHSSSDWNPDAYRTRQPVDPPTEG